MAYCVSAKWEEGYSDAATYSAFADGIFKGGGLCRYSGREVGDTVGVVGRGGLVYNGTEKESEMSHMIGILSDSHDNRDALRDAVRLFNRTGCRLVLHAGDFVAPFAAGELSALDCPVKAVFGNCDGEKAGLSKTVDAFGKIREAPFVFQLEGREFLLTHTHFSLESHIRSGRYDVIVYGHTHRPEVRHSDRSLVINPGEAGGWVTGKGSVALLDLSTLDAEIVPL